MWLVRSNRAKTNGSRTPCRQCIRIRIFLMVAMMLILSIFLVDPNKSRLAGITPMDVALTMMAIGGVAFLLRVIQHFLASSDREE